MATVIARATCTMLVALVAPACVSRSALPPAPSPADFERLETVVAADPGDLEAGLSLAAGYREAGRIEEGRSLVGDLAETHPDDMSVHVMAGLLAEDAEDWPAARTAYQAASATGNGGPFLGEVERRMQIVRRAELRAEVLSALAREEAVAQSEPDPATVGVFPFLYEGDDPTWEPLALAIPEMLATDLGVTGRLRVVERIRVQTLLDEMALGEAGRVDEETAARSGRLLGSGAIVQGSFRITDQTRIGVDAAVVDVRRPAGERVDPLVAEDAVERLFALEKQLALDLHAELGVELTPAERERVNERQTESVQALLEFGRGIAAENAADFEGAREHFQAALSIDPGFALAQVRGEAVAQMGSVSIEGTAGQLTDAIRQVATQRQAVQHLRNAPAGLRARVLQNLGADKRAVLAEVLGQDRVGHAILLEIVFRPPGGAP